MNNKGFAVSAVLYTLLIAFLLFLGAALAMFSSSNSLISNANSDIVNGNVFSASQVLTNDNVVTETGEIPALNYKWENHNNFRAFLQIKSKYGIKYWPKDFSLIYNTFPNPIEVKNWNLFFEYKKLKFKKEDDTIFLISGINIDDCTYYFKSGNIIAYHIYDDSLEYGKLIIEDVFSKEKKTITLYNQK